MALRLGWLVSVEITKSTMKRVTYKCLPKLIHIRIASSLVPSQSGTGCHWNTETWHYQNYLDVSSLSDAGKWPTHRFPCGAFRLLGKYARCRCVFENTLVLWPNITCHAVQALFWKYNKIKEHCCILYAKYLPSLQATVENFVMEYRVFAFTEN